MTHLITAQIIICSVVIVFIIMYGLSFVLRKVNNATDPTSQAANNKKAVTYLVGFAITIFVLFCIFCVVLVTRPPQHRMRDSIIAHKAMTIGTINYYRAQAGREQPIFVWSCSANGVAYTHGATTAYVSNGLVFVNEKFPVVYDSTDIRNRVILIFPGDFEEFQIPFPDSLNWVNQYERHTNNRRRR